MGQVRSGLLLAALGLVSLGTLGGTCERPPVDPPGDGGSVEGRVAINFLKFSQDRPAVGGDWYLYQEEAGHFLEPFDHVYVVRDGPAANPKFGAIRLVSYYDPDTAESGRFTVRVGTWDGTIWTTTEAILLSKNLKTDGEVCIDFFGAALEVNCSENNWQVILRAYPFLAREGPIVVTRPGLFVRSVVGTDSFGNVRIATLDERTTLDDLPDPNTLTELEDGPPSDWSPLTYDLGRLAPNLPVAGMAMGDRFLDPNFIGRDDVFFMVNAARSVVRFQVRPSIDGAIDAGFRFTWATNELDLDDNTIADGSPTLLMADIPVPLVGETIFLSFEEANLLMDQQYMQGAELPHLPPNERRWDLALTQRNAGVVRMLLSPSAALANVSVDDPEADLSTAKPPR